MGVARALALILWAALIGGALAAAAAAWKWRVAEDSTRMFDAEEMADRLSGLSAALKARIEGSGIKLSYTEFLSVWLTAMLGPALLTLALGLGVLPAACLAALGGVGPWVWLRGAKSRNMKRFSDDLGDALPLMAANLRAGMSLRQSLTPVARNLDEPIRGEFQILTAELDQGVPVDVALTNMATRNQNKDLDLLACAVATQQEMGGNLAEIVDTTAQTIRVRTQLRRSVASKTSEQRASAKFLLVFPFVIVAVMCVVESTFRDFYTQPTGWAVLVVAVLIESIGYFFVKKMTDIETD